MTGHDQDKSALEELERCLGDALAHLYDPTYRPPELLWTVTGCDPRQGVEDIQRGQIGRATRTLVSGP